MLAAGQVRVREDAIRRAPESEPRAAEDLVARLRAGDESAFSELVDSLHGRLLALARSFCSQPEVAEEAVQETWIGVIQGIHRYDGRAPLRSWIFGILVRRARTLAVREKRHQRGMNPDERKRVEEGEEEREPGMGPSGRWIEPPTPWGLLDPEAAMLARETLEVVQAALERLPPTQRAAVLLRDVEGLDTAESCNVLEVSETNLRVLVHRGRAAIRRALDAYRRGVQPGPSNLGRPGKQARC